MADPIRKPAAHFGKQQAWTYIEAVKLVGPVNGFQFVACSAGTVYGKQKLIPSFSIAVSYATLYMSTAEIIKSSGRDDLSYLLSEIEETINRLMEDFSDDKPRAEKTPTRNDIAQQIADKLAHKGFES